MGNSQKTDLFSLLSRHWKALSYTLKVIVPNILRTGRRPVIFYRWSGLGDIICTIPAASKLKERHPGSSFFYNCDPDFAAIPQLTGVVDECTHFEEIDVVGHWYRFLLSGYYHFAHGDDLPNSVAVKPMYQEFCARFGVPLAESHPALPVSGEASRAAREQLAQRHVGEENLILFHCGPTWPVKEWPAEAWTDLANGLRSHGFMNLAQIGLGGYMKSQQTQPQHSLNAVANLTESSVRDIPGTVSLVGALSLEEVIAAISIARLFVGVDSGLLHVAACLGTPAVGIFGPTLPEMFYPEKVRENFIASGVDCAGCHHRVPRLHWITGCPYGIKCMRTIKATHVLGACLRELSLEDGSLPDRPANLDLGPGPTDGISSRPSLG